MMDFHFLRPYWLFVLIPLAMLGYALFKQKLAALIWGQACDAHLLPYLLKNHGQKKQIWPLMILMSSAVCMVIALAGPTWLRIPIPIYQQIHPRVVLLDLSASMLAHDLQPDRLTRAKFKLHDLLQQQDAGQFGLIVYTSEPFVVSPLTDDGQTIDSLLPSLTPDIMPVTGHQLDRALNEAQKIIADAGFEFGDILIFTGQIPSNQAVLTAQSLARLGIHTSIIPLLKDKTALPLFEPLATAGQGMVIPFSNQSTDIEKWLKTSRYKQTYQANDMKDIPLWHDEGRWFILMAVVFMLPVFWRGWLQRIST